MKEPTDLRTSWKFASHGVDGGVAGAMVEEQHRYNVVEVHLDPSVPTLHGSPGRNLLHDLVLRPVREGEPAGGAQLGCPHGPLRVSMEALAQMPHRLKNAERAFNQTVGLHAARLYTPGGDLILICEEHRPPQRGR